MAAAVGVRSKGQLVAEVRHDKPKAELKKIETEIEQMIVERQLKILEIQCTVEVSKDAADREAVKGVQVFTALIKSLQTSLNQLIEEIQDKQRTTRKQAEDVIRELQEEICLLQKRSTEVQRLSGSKDCLHVVQRVTCVTAAPLMKTWTEVTIRPPSYERTVVTAVSQLEDKFREAKKKVDEAELKRLQRNKVDVTLDPDTANPYLIVSDDGKRVHDSDRRKWLPNKPQRFTDTPCILAKQSFSSGRFYYEVLVKGKTDWAFGVARESINRKGQITLSPQNGFWTLWLTNRDEYIARAQPDVRLHVKTPLQKVGVFVDYDEGLVSFYDVDSSVLIYSFIGCCFSDKLLPFFCPWSNAGGLNSVPLTITPVDTE